MKNHDCNLCGVTCVNISDYGKHLQTRNHLDLLAQRRQPEQTAEVENVEMLVSFPLMMGTHDCQFYVCTAVELSACLYACYVLCNFV